MNNVANVEKSKQQEEMNTTVLKKHDKTISSENQGNFCGDTSKKLNEEMKTTFHQTVAQGPFACE